jgi:ATP-dependent RNA helicase DeaD
MTTFTFNDLNINPKIKKAIDDLKYETMTPIQERAIPVILENRDLLGMAQTGTGKTAAYVVPMMNKIDPTSKVVQTLILCPTRELAIQVTREVKKIYKYLDGVKVVPVYGGQSYDIQINALKGNPQIVVGTPGRIIDLMDRSLLKFGTINTLILDEADEMLKMGFQEDLETILEKTPKTRQTLMFSATLPKAILSTANKYLNNYERIEIEATHMTVDKIEQAYFLVKEAQKMDLFIRLFDYHKLSSAMIFLNTKKGVDDLAIQLQSSSYTTAGLHGDLKQSQRDRVMDSFRNRHIQILLATDVAARGLDIDDVDAVFNYDLPQEEEIYVHRIGRTGRAGKSGKSFTFVTKGQMYHLHSIEKTINQPIPKGHIPSVEEVKESEKFKNYPIIKERLALGADSITHPVVDKLMSEGFTEAQIMNALLSLVNKEDKKGYNEIEFVEDRPNRDRDRSTKSFSRNDFSRGSTDSRRRSRSDDGNAAGARRRTGSDARPFGEARSSEARPFGESRPSSDARRDHFPNRRDSKSRDLGYKVVDKDTKPTIKSTIFIEASNSADVTVGSVLTALKKNKINHRDIGNIEIRKNGIVVEIPQEHALKISSKGTINLNQKDMTVKMNK